MVHHARPNKGQRPPPEKHLKDKEFFMQYIMIYPPERKKTQTFAGKSK